MMTHIEELNAAGVPIASHESDLYCRDTPESREIIQRHGYSFTLFRNQRPPHQGELWLDVSFAYLPFWEAKARRVP